MLSSKIIVCSRCKYFPNKADQIERHGIRFLLGGIEWLCDYCKNSNLYVTGEPVVLPEASCLTVEWKDLLNSQSERKDSSLTIVIDVDSLQGGLSVYHCPKFKKQIEQSCGIQLSHLKNTEKLEQESEWFAKYRSILRSYAKLTKRLLFFTERLAHLDYLIYLLEAFVSSKQLKGGEELSITVLKGSRNFNFEIGSKRLVQGSELVDFLKIYALLQFEGEDAWISNFYRKILANYENRAITRKRSGTVLFVGKKGDFNLNISHKEILFLQLNGESNTNIFGISPISINPLIECIQQFKRGSANDQVIIFFKKQGEKDLFKEELVGNETQLIKNILFQTKTSIDAKQDSLRRHLKKHLRGMRVKLVKMYCRFAQKEEAEKIVLFTFNWAAIERQLLVEELDDETQEQCRFNQGILSEPLTILPPPSPFLKKQQKQRISDYKPPPQLIQQEYL